MLTDIPEIQGTVRSGDGQARAFAVRIDLQHGGQQHVGHDNEISIALTMPGKNEFGLDLVHDRLDFLVRAIVDLNIMTDSAL